MLSHTSTAWAPWHVIPADHKWFSHLSTSAVLLETLRDLNPHYPPGRCRRQKNRTGASKEGTTRHQHREARAAATATDA